jgi:hypothetical protein
VRGVSVQPLHLQSGVQVEPGWHWQAGPHLQFGPHAQAFALAFFVSLLVASFEPWPLAIEFI